MPNPSIENPTGEPRSTLARFGLFLAVAAIAVNAPRLILVFLEAEGVPVASDLRVGLLALTGVATGVVLTGGGAFLAHAVAWGHHFRRILVVAWLIVLVATGVLITPMLAAGLAQAPLTTVLASSSSRWIWSAVAVLAVELVAAGSMIAYAAHRREAKLNAAADYVKTKLASVAEYLIYTSAGYGLRNVANEPQSAGFPVVGGNIGTFPENIDLIGYTAYDIFDPTNDAHPLNINQEPWSTISHKLDQALVPGQKTVGVVKGYCTSSDSVWGISCPPNQQNWWKLGILAENWARYLRDDPRNLFMLIFTWSDAGFSGTESLPILWPYHAAIEPNCTVPPGAPLNFWHYEIQGFGGGAQAGNPSVTTSPNGRTIHAFGLVGGHHLRSRPSTKGEGEAIFIVGPTDPKRRKPVFLSDTPGRLVEAERRGAPVQGPVGPGSSFEPGAPHGVTHNLEFGVGP